MGSIIRIVFDELKKRFASFDHFNKLGHVLYVFQFPIYCSKFLVDCSIIFVPAANYLLKVNKRNTRVRIKICSKLTWKTQERNQWHSGFLISSLSTLKKFSENILGFPLLILKTSKYQLRHCTHSRLLAVLEILASKISNKMGPRIHPLTTPNNVYKSRTTHINLHKMFSNM